MIFNAMNPDPEIIRALLLPGLVFLRVSASFFFLPGFGETMIPMRVRLALALAFTAAIVPMVPAAFDPAVRPVLALAGAEVVIGLAIGLAVRLVYVALQVAGVMAAQVTSLSQLLGSDGNDPQPALSAILMMAGLSLAMSLGLGVHILAYYADLYEIMPIGALGRAAPMTGWIAEAVSAMFSLAFVLAAPFLIVSVLYNLGLGVINKAMPQLMVAFVGAPAITFGTIALLTLTAPFILTNWIEALDLRLEKPFETGR